MSRWRVTVRTGPKVEKVRYDALETRSTRSRCTPAPTANTERRGAIDVRVRRYEARDQVAARVELSGPGVAAGVDVRGDGAVQGWTGRWRRQPLPLEERRDGLRGAPRRQMTSVEP